MKIWQLLTSGLKKYENLACEVLEGSTRYSYLSCHMSEGFFMLSKISYFFCLEPKIPALNL